MYAGQTLVADDGYEVALYPMTSIDITQSYAGSASHRCRNITNTGLWDVIGHSGATNRSNIYAPFSGTITVQKSSGNQRVLSSSNKVHLANGTLQYANFGWGHDNQLLVNLGDYVTQGQLIGYTGTKDASSRHSHFMLGVGEWNRGNYLPVCYSTGAGGNIYYMPNPIDIDDMFYANDTSIYTFYIDGLTLNWRTWNSPTPSTVTVTTSVSPSGAGSVSGGGTYSYGASVTLTATANSGHTFTAWSTGQTTSTIVITANSNLNITAYFDGTPPTPPQPETKTMTVVPTSVTLFIPKEGNKFRIDFTMTGTPDGGQWLWYPDIAISSPNISLESLNPNYWYYTSYTGSDGNPYIRTEGAFDCIIPWNRSLSEESATYTINFSRWNSSWTQCDLSQTVTINVTYEEGGAVLFLRYDGGAVEIR